MTDSGDNGAGQDSQNIFSGRCGHRAGGGLGNTFLGRIVEETEVGSYKAIRCTTTGRVFTLSRARIQVNPQDWSIPQYGLLELLEEGRRFVP